MTTIRADLTALTRDGLLQAYVSLIEDSDGRVPHVGDRLFVLDMMGGDDAYVATIQSIDGNLMLLDVAWDVEYALIAEPADRSSDARGLSFDSVDHIETTGNTANTAGVLPPGILISA